MTPPTNNARLEAKLDKLLADYQETQMNYSRQEGILEQEIKALKAMDAAQQKDLDAIQTVIGILKDSLEAIKIALIPLQSQSKAIIWLASAFGAWIILFFLGILTHTIKIVTPRMRRRLGQLSKFLRGRNAAMPAKPILRNSSAWTIQFIKLR